MSRAVGPSMMDPWSSELSQTCSRQIAGLLRLSKLHQQKQLLATDMVALPKLLSNHFVLIALITLIDRALHKRLFCRPHSSHRHLTVQTSVLTTASSRLLQRNQTTICRVLRARLWMNLWWYMFRRLTVDDCNAAGLQDPFELLCSPAEWPDVRNSKKCHGRDVERYLSSTGLLKCWPFYFSAQMCPFKCCKIQRVCLASSDPRPC